jgi:hypothetical protein
VITNKNFFIHSSSSEIRFSPTHDSIVKGRAAITSCGLKEYEPFRQSVRVMVVDYRPSIESEGRASKGKKWTPIGHEEDKGHS